jgi:FdhE protein
VAAGFLGKLMGRPSLPPTLTEARNELARLARERPARGQPASVLADVIPWLFVDAVRESPPELTATEAVAKLDSGIPLLRGERLDLDAGAFRRRWRGICAAVRRHRQGEAARELAKALRPNGLDAAEMTQEVLAGRPEAVHARAAALGLDPALTATVLRWTLFPVLGHVRAALDPFFARTRWGRGCCPACGSWPLLGEFRGLEQTRFLRCGLCAAAWEFPHLTCPFCGERDHRQLGYLHVEGEEGKERAATCDACQGYVKMISSLSALAGPQLLVADVATLHLDLAAAERGFFVG